MRFLRDENFPKAAVSMLRSAGHEVFDVRGTNDEGMEDDALHPPHSHEHGYAT